MKRYWLACLACLPLAVQAYDISKVNGSIHVTAGSTPGDVGTVNGAIRIDDGVTARNVETVNGSVTVGRDAVVEGVESVNGGVTLGANARAERVETVNGTMRIATGAQISGDVTAVNSSMTLEQNAQVRGDLENVNGRMTLKGARVGGRLKTVAGDITVGPGSHVQGGILVEKPDFNWSRRNNRKPRIVIGPDAVIEGDLRFERDVDLFVSDRAKIGRVEGAKAVTFSGAEP